MKHKRILQASIIACVLTIGIISYSYRHIWQPYTNEYLVGHKYNLPAPNAPFIIAKEPRHESIPLFLQNMLRKAFHEYHVVFDNNHPNPNLIVRGECHGATRKTILQKDIPYIALSGEPKGIRKDQHRPYGLPFAEVVTFTPTKDRQVYAPFMAWSNIDLIADRKYTNYSDRKFLAYVSEHCIRQRETFFAIARATGLGAKALGKCSNTTNGETVPGGYSDLNDVYAQYHFVMAMENTQKPGYITEKIVNAFNSGAIPIYWGDSATVKSIFNPNAFIDLSDYANFSAAMRHIKYLLDNPTELEKMRNAQITLQPQSPYLANYNQDMNNPEIVLQAQKLRGLYDAMMQRHQEPPRL